MILGGLRIIILTLSVQAAKIAWLLSSIKMIILTIKDKESEKATRPPETWTS